MEKLHLVALFSLTCERFWKRFLRMKCDILNLVFNAIKFELVLNDMWSDFESTTKLENWKLFLSCWPNGQVCCGMFCFENFGINYLSIAYQMFIGPWFQKGSGMGLIVLDKTFEEERELRLADLL